MISRFRGLPLPNSLEGFIRACPAGRRFGVLLVAGLALGFLPGRGLAQEPIPLPEPVHVLPELNPGADLTSHVDRLADLASRSLVRVIRVDESDGGLHGNRNAHRIIGTGVAVGAGQILTCAGLVGSASEVLVSSLAADTLVARVVGIDRRSNLAVLEAPGLGLAPIPIAAASLIFPGEWVVAVGLGSPGTPLASFGTVVVADGPNLGFSEVDMIQTTTPVFRGYTGGALMNQDGELVGIVSGVMELDTGNLVLPEGSDMVAGFLHQGRLMTITPSAATVVLPIHQAMEVASQLTEFGEVRRGYLGLEVELTPTGNPAARAQRRGVLIHRVVDNGPAARAGLLPGDFIVEFGGVRVTSPEDLSFLVASRLPGTDAPVRFIRRGYRDLVVVKLEQAPVLDWAPEMDEALAGRETTAAPNGLRRAR